MDSILAVQEVCTRISELKQQFKNKHGKMDIMSPDELFNLYLQLIPSLPNDASSWTGIQLGSSFFNALIDELKNKMLQDNFRMPPPVHPAKLLFHPFLTSPRLAHQASLPVIRLNVMA